MKKLIIFSFIFLPLFAHAQSECVLGLVNDPAPGSCGSYLDIDGNDLCDLSEYDVSDNRATSNENEQGHVSEEELKQYSVAEVAALYGVSEKVYADELSGFLGMEITGNDSMQILHDENGLCTGVAATIASSLQDGGGVESVDPNSLISGSEIKGMKIYEIAEVYNISEEELANKIAEELGIKVKQGEMIQVLHDNYGLEASKVKEIAGSLVEKDEMSKVEDPVTSPVSFAPRYRFVPIVFSILFLYLITYILVLQKKITILTMRRIWNVLLMISFAISAVLGLLLIIRINYGLYIGLPFNMLYWHVEFATMMSVITLIHISWYWRFYTSMFGSKK